MTENEKIAGNEPVLCSEPVQNLLDFNTPPQEVELPSRKGSCVKIRVIGAAELNAITNKFPNSNTKGHADAFDSTVHMLKSGIVSWNFNAEITEENIKNLSPVDFRFLAEVIGGKILGKGNGVSEL